MFVTAARRPPKTAVPCLALALCIALGSSSSAAQSKGEGPRQYRDLVEQALTEFQHGNWDEAAGLFEQAHRIYPNARTLRGMGIAAFEGRRYVAALEHLRAALTSRVNPLTQNQRSEVQEAIARAERYVASLEIAVAPEDAEVRVNGAVLEAQGGTRTIQLDPGPVRVVASAADHEPLERELRVVSGAHERLTLRLLPSPGARGSRDDGGPQFGAWKWIALGAGGLGLIGGVISHVQREQAASDYNRDAACQDPNADAIAMGRCNDYHNDVDDAELRMAIGYGAGAVLTGVAVLLFVLEGEGDAPAERAASGCQVGFAAAQCSLRF